jgi:hypothetical protein
MICTATSGNGAGTGLPIMIVVPLITLAAPLRARAASFGAVAGSTTWRICGPPIVAASSRTAAGPSLASDWSILSSSVKRSLVDEPDTVPSLPFFDSARQRGAIYSGLIVPVESGMKVANKQSSSDQDMPLMKL